jgi:glycosyltransferase involved in cell wall biosynthesis
MRVLVISGAFVPAPIAEADHAYHTCAELVRRGHRVDVLTAATGDRTEIDGIGVMRIMRNWSWRESVRLIRALRATRPDAVLLFYLPNLFGSGAVIALVGSVVRWWCPKATFTVFFSNVGTGSGLGALKQRLARWAGRYKYGTLLTASTTVFYESEIHGARLRALHPGAKNRLVFRPPPALITWPDLAPAEARAKGRQLAGCGADDLVIAFFGRIYQDKGIETLIDSFAEIAGRHAGARLLLIGGVLDRADSRTYADALTAQADKLGLGAKLTWTGEYEWDDPAPSLYLHAADLCVLPFVNGVSLANSSLAVVSGHGLPIVTTQAGALETQFRDGDNVLVCPPRDSDALTESILKVVGDRELRDRLCAGSAMLYRDHYSLAGATDKVIAALTTAD